MFGPGDDTTEFDEFVPQMYLLVHEEAGLWELPIESTVVGKGSLLCHGPWPPESCSALMLRWLDAGLVNVYRSQPGKAATDLASEDARRILGSIREWRLETDLFVFATAAGQAAAYKVWFKSSL